MTIRPLSKTDLDALDRLLPFRPPTKQLERLRMQERGEGLYLVAWIGSVPVGHVLVLWKGRAGYPELRDVFVAPAHRNRGAGSELLQAAELEAAQRSDRVGLAVAIENVGALRLYARCGYEDAELAPFVLSYTGWGDDGVPSHIEEICVYLVKRLIAVRRLTAKELARVDRHLPLNRLDEYRAGLAEERSIYLVAWDGRTPVGHAHLVWRGHAGLPEIQDVFVPPERRREGIGSLLTAAAEREAASRGLTQIGLTVSVDNEPALRLYKRCAYVDADERPFRVSGTILLRDAPVAVDDVLVFLVKTLEPA